MVAEICLLTLLTVLRTETLPLDVVPLLHAHAHNDYRHDPPLLRALEHGFTSAEADVFLVDGKLCVAHDFEEITADRTLRSLYLEPLRQRIRKNGGRVYRDGPRFVLLVDVKSAPASTYLRMHEILAEYAGMLTTFRPDGRQEKAVLVIVSGNRAPDLMRDQPVRYAGCDGRLTDLDADAGADLIPLISDHWGRHFRWRGDGPMPAEERRRLSDILEKAHAKGRLVRFWATPDERSPARRVLWGELLLAGVDLINTDDLVGLQEFLLEHECKRLP